MGANDLPRHQDQPIPTSLIQHRLGSVHGVEKAENVLKAQGFPLVYERLFDMTLGMDSGETIDRLREAAHALKTGDTRTRLRAIHTTWWSRGGRTDLNHLIGLCVRCHHLIHRERLNVTADGTGHFTFTTKNGRPLSRSGLPRPSRQITRPLDRRRDVRVPVRV